MAWQKLTKYVEALNYTKISNISNAFQTDNLQDITFADMSCHHRATLTGICVIVMLGILFTNATVIICLFKTNQTSNLSFRTILHLSFSDVLVALVALPTFIFGTVSKTNSRLLVIASPFFSSLFTHVSGYLIGLIGVDRFIRIEYYTKHREILTPVRVFVTQILIWGLALLNATLIVLCLLYKIPAFRIFLMLCDVSFIVLVVILQIKTILSRKTVLVLPESSTDQKIRILATKIIISISVLLPPYLICGIVRDKIQATLTEEGKGQLQFIFGRTIILAHLNSFTNAVLFLANNLKSKQYLRSFLKGNADSRVNPCSTKSKQKMSLPINTIKITVSSKY